MWSYPRSVAHLSDALPQPVAHHAISVASSALLAPVGSLRDDFDNHAAILSPQASYRELARIVRLYPASLGVLVVDSPPTGDGVASLPPSRPAGLISRQRFVEWRSHRPTWRAMLDQSLTAQTQWWQTASSYVLIDEHLPLQDAIDLLLEQAPHTQEPVVIQSAEGFSLCDRARLFETYARLSRSEHIQLGDRDIETLRRQQQLILNAIGEGVYGVDLQGNATFVNPAAAQMVGWEAEDMIGQSMHQLLHHSRPDQSPYPREECPIYAAFQDGIIHRVAEEMFWRKDGTCFPVEYISTPMRDENGKLVGAVIAFRDITQRKWAEAVLHRANEELEQRVRDRTIELQQANEQLKELSELRSRVVTMVCHEFRNPLNNILLSVSSLGRYDAQLTPAHKEEYLLSIEDNVERMTQMIDAILIIGRVEAKDIEVQPTRFDLIPFCQEIVAELRLSSMADVPEDTQGSSAPGLVCDSHRRRRDSQRTQCDRLQFFSRSKQLNVTLDGRLLRSILTNLLSNSLRYTPPPGTIQLKVSKHKDQVILQIADQGIGIPPEDVPYLFEPFHRGRNVSNIAGTGLGLNIVKRFVDLQGGQVEVTSQLGKGTTVQVILPLHYSHL